MFDLFKYSDKQIDEIIKSMVILIDTREHENKNLHITNYLDSKEIKWKKKKLEYGDYSFMIPANPDLDIPRDLIFSNKIIVERKASLEELSGNLTKDRDRLEKELALAPEHKVLIIESGSYKDMCNANYTTKYSNKAFWATYHTFWHRYDVPIIFMPDRNYTGMFIRGHFTYYLKNYMKG